MSGTDRSSHTPSNTSRRAGGNRTLPPRVVALVGNPNTGKTTLFNKLTGLRQHVGHHPGVTVESKSGRLRGCDAATPIEIIDLPGAYSLSADSADEAVVLDCLSQKAADDAKLDIIVCVVDAKNLQRNLFFVSQIMEIGIPVIVALNMIDLAEVAGIAIDSDKLADVLGIPVVPLVASKNIGVDALRVAISKGMDVAPPTPMVEFPEIVAEQFAGLARFIHDNTTDHDQMPSEVELLQALLAPAGYHEQRLVDRLGPAFGQELNQRRADIESAGFSVVELEARVRYDVINRVILKTVTRKLSQDRTQSDVVDRVLTHPVWGLLILVVILGAVFQSVYAWSAPVMGLIDQAFAGLATLTERWIPPGAISSLVSGGVIAGVGGVLIFLPQILVLFLFIAIMEDCGYMSRAALLLDRYMRLLGLNGKSFIPLLSSFACAIPGIMATRTIDSPRDRLLTIVVAPLMSCSARLPVYMLLISVFIPDKALLGGVTNYRTLTLLAMYFVGIFVAIVITFILKRTLIKGRAEPFLMELPSFKWFSPSTVLLRVYDRGKHFVIQAGTIIFAMTIVVWALGYYPKPAGIAVDHEQQRITALREYENAQAGIFASLPEPYEVGADESGDVEQLVDRIDEIESTFQAKVEREGLSVDSQLWQTARLDVERRLGFMADESGAAGNAALAVHGLREAHHARLAKIDHSLAGAYLRQSILGRMGRWIEPAVKPLGWDWRIGTAVIASFPAREVVISTMATIYNLGGEQDESSAGLQHTIANVSWPDGKPVFNLAVALSVMVFFALCCQCGATLAAIRRETNSWRWPAFTFAYLTALAYIAALATYQVAIRFV